MFTESQVGYFRAREAEVGTAGAGRSHDSPTVPGSPGGVHDEPLLGSSGREPPPTWSVLDYPTPTPVTADNLAGPLGLRALAGPGARRARRR